jgi:two-component sensor histidine kinase/CheY-like chemotaxis protein
MKVKALYIEDNPADARILQEFIKEQNEDIEIESITTLQEGIKVFNEANYDIILLDLQLPDSTNLSSLVTLVSKITYDVPIIVFTVLGEEQMGMKAIEMGAQDYLVKDETNSLLLVKSIKYSLARKSFEKKIKESLQEKELLLKELNHRVKNNLQMMHSIINIQLYSSTDNSIIEQLKLVQNRIQSLGLIHNQLNRGNNVTDVDLKEYLNELLDNIKFSFSFDESKIKIIRDIDVIKLDYNSVVPIGLVVNELVTNSIKYAFPANRKGIIKIGVYNCGEDIEINIEDDGVGFPQGFDFENSGGSGIQLVRLLIEQIEGKIELIRKGGSKYKILLTKARVFETA